MKDVTSKRCLALWRIMRQLKARGLQLEGILVSVFFFLCVCLIFRLYMAFRMLLERGGSANYVFWGWHFGSFFQADKVCTILILAVNVYH